MRCTLPTEHPAQPDLRDQQVQRVPPALKVLRENQVWQDQRVPRERQVHKDLKGQQARKDPPVLFKTVPTRATCIIGTARPGY